MTGSTFICILPDSAATEAMAQALAERVAPGDVFLLHGPVGAGKTALSRAMITALRARAGLPREDVPSPTFTLVQTYDVGAFDVWHADLYRLSGPDAVTELGLDEAFETALCLIEWPDRLGLDRPQAAIDIMLDATPDDRRRLTITGPRATMDRLRPAFARGMK
ncbi:tRNA threonylcarbamoyladenosine biosynthesis protein TsaE [Jannaschia faecimaris]|uniref:tRNA threonylcarbamoyladenosine biosynthesis protein TsaE n=1 Tax=Jannaschia faecimaris TaxID=1244108 RepID=A0A1H3IJJ6_9RHOB|nr:tRNA (adenosine(37)-N6)-threonylcarbamoyltransferase complex ATPase subunit type 1 TsaE [Jannaschia faecimaris]SDY27449.1 tRNA threonylcarbamoyladenosine biosynthesis protein TsaE [Jannaschia faecimaris]